MKKIVPGILSLILAAAFAPAVATAADDWKFAVTPYLWAAGMNGTATIRSHEADVEKDFGEILDDLSFAFMVNMQARKGRFGLYGDLTYLGQEDTNDLATPSGVTVLEAETSMDSWIVDFGASWEVTRWGAAETGTGGFLDVLVGGRYWTVDTDIEADIPFVAGERKVEKGFDWVDPVVGARVVTDLTPKLQLIGRADVGGFEVGEGSKLTWSAAAYLGWRFTPTISGWFGYKHLDVEREDDRENSLDMAFSGPVLGVSFVF